MIEIAADIEHYHPQETQRNLQAIYFFGVPYSSAIRAIQKKLLPLLKIGEIFEGPTPYYSGEYEGELPENLGLASTDGTFVKFR